MEQNPNKVKGILKVGDKVSWRGTWGTDAPQEVIVDAIEANCNGTKEGTPVESIEWDEVTRENVVVTLSNNHWAYGNQIKEI